MLTFARNARKKLGRNGWGVISAANTFMPSVLEQIIGKKWEGIFFAHDEINYHKFIC